MAQTWELSYLLTDHLGSVVAVTDSSGALISQQRYLPFGGVRTVPNSPITNTDYGYTGQRNLDDDLGLMDYKARFYSPVLNRFIQPDTIVPNPMNPQAYNRFSYVLNSPINFNDPTGHRPCSSQQCLDGLRGLSGGSSKSNKGMISSGNSGKVVDEPVNGIFTEEELATMDIHCGQNATQQACEVYTQTSQWDYIGANVTFANNTAGGWFSGVTCDIIWQGCTPVNEWYELTFSFTGNPMYWNRYSDAGMLFSSNWTTATYNGATVAYETFPLQGGELGSVSVYLQPTAIDGGIQWVSVAMEYNNSKLDINSGAYPTPNNLITFLTKADGSNGFTSTGILQLANIDLGTINIYGYNGALP